MLRPSDHVRVDRPHQRPGARSREISEWICRRGLAQSRPTVAVAGRAAMGGAELSRRAGGGARRAEFVPESAPEREDLKRALLARLDAVLHPEIVIASSSSGLLMSRVQLDCLHPERCVIGHPFNPPHLVP